MERDNIKSQQNQQLKTDQLTSIMHKQIKKQVYSFTTDGLPPIICKKIEGLVKILNANIINSEAVKKYLAQGIPDEASQIRQYCWKVILGYLPEDKSKWQSTITNQTQIYEGLVNMFLPPQKFPEHPLILKKDHPRYKELQNDYLLWEQIEKDTSRTHAEFSFFAMQSTEIMMPYFTNARREKFKLINGEDQTSYKNFLASKQLQRKTYRYDYMTRILYIYSKLNPKIQYVQGMNQILAPIFYLVNVTKPTNAIEQASCFFMFNNSICDIIELHIKDFDKSKNGIYGKLNEVNQMLMVLEPKIWRKMDELKIDPFFYCFRWITLLYAQDFALFDTLRIWQSIFSSQNRMQFIKFFAVAIMISCKQVIQKGDFIDVLQYLQNIKENINVNAVIAIANDLFKQHKQDDFNELAIKGKKKMEKQRKKQMDKKQKEQQRIQKLKQKEAQKNRQKQQKEKEKEKEKKQTQKNKDKQKDKLKGQRQKKQTSSSQTKSIISLTMENQTETSSLQKKQKEIQNLDEKERVKKKTGLFKKFGNMFDKFLN